MYVSLYRGETRLKQTSILTDTQSGHFASSSLNVLMHANQILGESRGSGRFLSGKEMKAECPTCHREGVVEQRGNSVRILHYEYVDGK